MSFSDSIKMSSADPSESVYVIFVPERATVNVLLLLELVSLNNIWSVVVVFFMNSFACCERALTERV